ncbi:MAG: PilZ domain-containing protein, partial [Aestuariivirgaceae bacterium]
ALNQLQNRDLQQVLATVPVHQLARALEQLLRPGDSVPVQHGAIDTDPDNQREAERSKTLRTGKIIYNNKMSVTDCKVLDLSNSGCRVALESLTGIPDHFMLHIVHGNAKHECEVTWRKSNMMGLKFIG